jgi:hypothetical protein
LAHAALCGAALSLASCGGARHRKVAGPPPEYERPDEGEIREPKDGGAASTDAGAASGVHAESMLISPDGR